MATEQVALHDDQQPEPQYEHEYCEGVGDEIAKRESAIEQHCRSSRPASRARIILDQQGRDSQRSSRDTVTPRA
jgi:hypothetical protein